MYPDRSARSLGIPARILMLVVACAALVLAFRMGPRFDYVSYLRQWNLVLSGQNPWGELPQPYGVNAYGPIHNLFALLMPMGEIVPKLAEVTIYMAACWRCIAVASRSTRGLPLYAGAAVLLFHPMTMIFGYVFGANDLVVAAFIALAFVDKVEQRSGWAGFWLALAILLKFYPAIYLTFMMLDRGRIDRKLGISCAAITGAGFALAFAIWGTDVSRPFVFATERGSSLLSFHYSLYHFSWLVGGDANVELMRRWDVAIMAGLWLVSLLLAWRLRLDWLIATVLGSLFVMLNYKTGNPQYQMPFIAASALLLLFRGTAGIRAFTALLPYNVLIAVHALMYFAQPSQAWTALNFYWGFTAIALCLYAVLAFGLVELTLRHRPKPPLRAASPDREYPAGKAPPTSQPQNDIDQPARLDHPLSQAVGGVLEHRSPVYPR